jgi:choline dehydrogenase-like flavoprotein
LDKKGNSSVEHFDCIVIGSGQGGTPLARALARAGKQTALVEGRLHRKLTAILQTARMGGVPYTALRDGVFTHPGLSESLNTLFASMD